MVLLSLKIESNLFFTPGSEAPYYDIILFRERSNEKKLAQDDSVERNFSQDGANVEQISED